MQQELSWELNLEYAIFLKNGKMVFSMLLCSITRCRNSTQWSDKMALYRFLYCTIDILKVIVVML